MVIYVQIQKPQMLRNTSEPHGSVINRSTVIPVEANIRGQMLSGAKKCSSSSTLFLFKYIDVARTIYVAECSCWHVNMCDDDTSWCSTVSIPTNETKVQHTLIISVHTFFTSLPPHQSDCIKHNIQTIHSHSGFERIHSSVMCGDSDAQTLENRSLHSMSKDSFNLPK